MKRTLPLLALLLVAAGQLALAQATGRYQLVRIVEPTRAQLDILRSLDCDHIHGSAGEISVVLQESEIPLLQAAGAGLSVAIEDMERFYADRARNDRAAGGNGKAAPGMMASEAPANFILGSAGGFYTLEELDAELTKMAATYPNLVTISTIGTTTEGRPIKAIRIATRPVSDTTVPEVLYTAMHHAREPGGMMNLVYTMWDLLENYGNDPAGTWLVDNRALYFLPNLNPDGYSRNLRDSPNGGGLWRRNMRAQGDSGVDLNRNYGPLEYWDRQNNGSSEDVRSALYRGPSPFSEPETQAVRDFVLGRRFRIALNHHTFSNLLIWPFNWSRQPIADSSYYRIVSRHMALSSGYAPGNDLVGVGYSTRGVSDEWMYSYGNPSAAVISWTPESGSLDDGFWPPPSRIIPIAAATHPMNLLAASIAGPAPRVTAWERIDSNGGPMLRVTVTNLGREDVMGSIVIGINDESSAAVVVGLSSLQAKTVDLPIPSTIAAAENPRPALRIRIKDASGEIPVTIHPLVHPVERVIEESFEGTPAGWNLDRWDIENVAGRGRVVSDSPMEMYRLGQPENILQLARPLSLVDFDAAELTFDARWVILARDHEGAIEARRIGTSEWEKLVGEFLQIPYIEADTLRSKMRGDMGEWNRYRIVLDRYAGQEIDLRFVMRAPAAEVDTTFDGVMLDNIVVTGSRSGPAIVAEPGNERGAAINLYPNPFGDRLELSLDNAGPDTKITLVDALGRVVRRHKGTRVSFDTHDLPAGFYTAIATMRRGVMYSKVMLVR